MGLIGYQEQMHAYRAERDSQLAIAKGRVAVNRALGFWPETITFVSTDAPHLYSTIAGISPETFDYAVTIRRPEDVYKYGPEAITAIIPAETRWRSDYPSMLATLALREPTLPILLDVKENGGLDDPGGDVDTIMRLRVDTCMSAIARAALYYDLGGVPVLDPTTTDWQPAPEPVATTL